MRSDVTQQYIELCAQSIQDCCCHQLLHLQPCSVLAAAFLPAKIGQLQDRVAEADIPYAHASAVRPTHISQWRLQLCR